MEYIEENIRKRRGEENEPEKQEGPRDPFEELYHLNRYTSRKEEKEEGNVTNSMTMLTAIPEVDLGIEYVGYLWHTNPTLILRSTRLKNIEETEKAKRLVAEDQKIGDKKRPFISRDEEHLVATRCKFGTFMILHSPFV